MNVTSKIGRHKLMRAAVALAVCGSFAGGLVAGRVTADQPKMQEALDNLQTARANLQNASDDKGGHRRKALALTESAIAQVREGMRFDRRH